MELTFEEMGTYLAAEGRSEWQEYDRVHGTTVEEQLRMYGRCPILFSNAVERYGLSDNQVKVHCRDGCCPICGELLWEKYKNKLKTDSSSTGGN